MEGEYTGQLDGRVQDAISTELYHKTPREMFAMDFVPQPRTPQPLPAWLYPKALRGLSRALRMGTEGPREEEALSALFFSQVENPIIEPQGVLILPEAECVPMAYRAKALYDRLRGDLVICTGGKTKEGLDSGMVTRRILLDLGALAEDIFLIPAPTADPCDAMYAAMPLLRRCAINSKAEEYVVGIVAEEYRIRRLQYHLKYRALSQGTLQFYAYAMPLCVQREGWKTEKEQRKLLVEELSRLIELAREDRAQQRKPKEIHKLRREVLKEASLLPEDREQTAPE